MPTIQFQNGRPPVEAEPDANLMQALLKGGLPVASSCKGDGVCAKCRVRVVEGRTNLSKPNETELFLRERHGLDSDERISCQALVLGDVTVQTSYW